MDRQRTFTGTIARHTTQCVCPDTGKTGCWLFVGDSHRISGTQVSPIFGDLAELFTWTHANGWEGIGGAYRFAGSELPRQLSSSAPCRLSMAGDNRLTKGTDESAGGVLSGKAVQS